VRLFGRVTKWGREGAERGPAAGAGARTEPSPPAPRMVIQTSPH